MANETTEGGGLEEVRSSKGGSTAESSEGSLLFGAVARIRAIEGKYNLLRDRVLIINNNMIEQYKKIIWELRAIEDDIKEIKSDLFKIKDTLKHLVKELELFARKEDVRFLEKYINLWDPMKFATEKEVERIIEEKLKEIKEPEKGDKKLKR